MCVCVRENGCAARWDARTHTCMHARTHARHDRVASDFLVSVARGSLCTCCMMNVRAWRSASPLPNATRVSVVVRRTTTLTRRVLEDSPCIGPQCWCSGPARVRRASAQSAPARYTSTGARARASLLYRVCAIALSLCRSFPHVCACLRSSALAPPRHTILVPHIF